MESKEKSESKVTFPPKEISLPDESWRTDPVQEKIALAIDSPALPPLWLSGNKIHDTHLFRQWCQTSFKGKKVKILVFNKSVSSRT